MFNISVHCMCTSVSSTHVCEWTNLGTTQVQDIMEGHPKQWHAIRTGWASDNAGDMVSILPGVKVISRVRTSHEWSELLMGLVTRISHSCLWMPCMQANRSAERMISRHGVWGLSWFSEGSFPGHTWTCKRFTVGLRRSPDWNAWKQDLICDLDILGKRINGSQTVQLSMLVH